MNKAAVKKTLITTLVILVLGVAAYFIIPVSVPFILAGCTAFLLEPIITFVKRKWNWSRQLAVGVIYTISIAFISFLCYLTVTQLIAQVINMSKQMPMYIAKLTGIWVQMQGNIAKYTENLPVEVADSIQKTMVEFTNKLEMSIVNVFNYERITAFLGEMPSFLVSLLVYMIALFLFMLELPRLKEAFFARLKPSTEEKTRMIMNRLKDAVFGFMKAQFLVSLLIGGVAFIALLLIHPKYAISMGLVIWIIDVIPFLGSILVLAPWAIFYFLIGNTALGVKLLILAGILLIIRRTVEPKVMGSHIGLSPLPTLIAMFVGLKLFGIIGLLLGPLLIILIMALKEAGIIKMQWKI